MEEAGYDDANDQDDNEDNMKKPLMNDCSDNDDR